jgi:hypothetical protein
MAQAFRSQLILADSHSRRRLGRECGHEFWQASASATFHSIRGSGG